MKQNFERTNYGRSTAGSSDFIKEWGCWEDGFVFWSGWERNAEDGLYLAESRICILASCRDVFGRMKAEKQFGGEMFWETCGEAGMKSVITGWLLLDWMWLIFPRPVDKHACVHSATSPSTHTHEKVRGRYVLSSLSGFPFLLHFRPQRKIHITLLTLTTGCTFCPKLCWYLICRQEKLKQLKIFMMIILKLNLVVERWVTVMENN